MLGGRAVTVGAQRRARGGGGHGKCLGVVLGGGCPVALVKVVGIYGGEGMMGVCGGRVEDVVGVRRGRVGVDAVIVEMGCRGGGCESRIEEVMLGVLMMAELRVVRQLALEVGLGLGVSVADEPAFVVVVARAMVSVSLGMAMEVWVRLEIGISKARVDVLEVRLEARVEGHIHVVVHGGLSIGQARRAERLVGGLETHAASIDALASGRCWCAAGGRWCEAYSR